MVGTAGNAEEGTTNQTCRKKQDQVYERTDLIPGSPWQKIFLRSLGAGRGNQYLYVTVLNAWAHTRSAVDRF